MTDARSMVEDPAAPPAGTVTERVLEATVQCLARTGVAKTTLDDIARAAGCGRATIYRAFPGGKDGVVLAAGAFELRRFFERLAGALDEAETFEDHVVIALTEAVGALRTHPALRYLLDHEPEVVLPLVCFEGFDPLLRSAAEFADRRLTGFVDPASAREVGEWVARVAVSYGLDDEVADSFTDPAYTRRFVRTFLLPGLASPVEAVPATGAGIPQRTTTPSPAAASPTSQE